MKRVELLVALLLAVPNAAAAQPERADVIAAVGLESDARGPAVDDATQAAATPPAPSGVRRFVTDVGGDYKHFISWSTAKWLGAGGLAALAVHPADEPIQQDVLGSAAPVLPGGNVYGSQLFQVPLAAAWWMVGHAAGSERDVGGRAATCCARRSASSAGRTRSSTPPTARGRTAIPGRFRPATPRRASPRPWCCRSTTGGSWACRPSRPPHTPRRRVSPPTSIG